MKLVIINGPCGVGKSTLAIRLHDSTPLSYLLDIDAHSRNISHYREYREERWELSVAVARAIIDACLSVGRDVVVDKATYDPAVLDSYHQIAHKHGADVREIILWAPKNVVMKRADERGWKEGGLLTPETCERIWHEIDKLKEKRPQATVIDVSDMKEAEVFKKVQEVLHSPNVKGRTHWSAPTPAITPLFLRQAFPPSFLRPWAFPPAFRAP